MRDEGGVRESREDGQEAWQCMFRAEARAAENVHEFGRQFRGNKQARRTITGFSRLLSGLTVDPQEFCLGPGGRSAGCPEPVGQALAHAPDLKRAGAHANRAGADCLGADTLALPDLPDWLEEPGGSRYEHKADESGKGKRSGGGQ
jgi:hypothetical protein